MKIDGWDGKPYDGWLEVKLWLERGYYVPKEIIARKLRGNAPIPDEVRPYIADLLDGSIDRGRGQPADWPVAKERTALEVAQEHLLRMELGNVPRYGIRVWWAIQDYHRIMRVWRRFPPKSRWTAEDAIAKAADRQHVPESYLRNQLRRGRSAK